jgi:conjugative transposon TraM protein
MRVVGISELKKGITVEAKIYSPAFLRRRKFWMGAPLVFLPIVTFIVWAVDNFRTEEKPVAEKKGQHGLNKEVPKARLKEDKDDDKLAFYDEAQVDSIRKREWARGGGGYAGALPDSVHGSAGIPDPNEERVNEKIEELNRVLERRSDATVTPVMSPPSRALHLSENSVDRLERMMQSMKEDNGDNPEMKEMNAVLDKLMRVQHPEWARDSIKAAVQKEQSAALPVERVTGGVEMSGVENGSMATNRFYGLEDTDTSTTMSGALEAVVPERLELVSGAMVKLQLLQAVRVANVSIPAGTYIYGIAALNGERLMVGIHSVRFQDRILPVDLRVYDTDGLEGIYIPGAISRDVVKQSADQGINSMGLGVYDPSLGGQATQAGIQLAKGLMSRKIRQVRVTVEAGYRLLLKDNSHRL